MTMMMLQSALDHVPLWVWLVLAAAAAGAIFYFFSPVLIPLWNLTPKSIKIALGAIGAGIAAYLAGRQAGSRNERDLQKERDRRADDKGRQVRNEVENLNRTDLDKRASRWMRDE